MTPYEAIDNGASKLVIGRSISKAIYPNIDIQGRVIGDI